MKKILMAMIVSCLLVGEAQAGNIVLTASATSSAVGSAPTGCLLDPACQGTWSPGSLDHGVDEGVFFQFEQPVPAQAIEIAAAGPIDPSALKVYVNGKTKDSQNRYYVLTQDAQNTSLLRIARSVRPFNADTSPLSEPIKSLFLKVDLVAPASGDKVKIQKIRFLNNGQPVTFLLPALQPAQVSASSILDPQTAYHPAHLFDAKVDFAWSTDGKKNDGRGESAHLQFSQPQAIGSLIVWNGYQRSDMHYHANGRVSKLEIKPANGTAQTVALNDVMGPQRVPLATPLNGVSDLTFTIKDVVPGTKYKDTLISEMRFVTPQGQIVLPQTAMPQPSAPAAWAPLVDRSYSSFLFQPMSCKDCKGEEFGADFPRQRLRLRSDGSFVIYKSIEVQRPDSKEKPISQTADVLEGNWEAVPAGIRIFGKKYPTVIATSEYLKETAPTNDAAIFQSELHLKRYAELQPNEKQELFNQLWIAKKGPAAKAPARWDHCTLGQNHLQSPREIFGNTPTEVFQTWDRFLQGINPYVIQSTMLTDAFLPTEDGVDCEIGP